MQNNVNELAQNMISGEWLYYPQEKILKKVLGSDTKLKELDLIDAEGYLDAAFKQAVKELLDNLFAKAIVGPFGDDDIFSGDIFENETIYNIEIHNADLSLLNTLQQYPGVSIKQLS